MKVLLMGNAVLIYLVISCECTMLYFVLHICTNLLICCKRESFWGAAVAQWIRSRLPSCCPGFAAPG